MIILMPLDEGEFYCLGGGVHLFQLICMTKRFVHVYMTCGQYLTGQVPQDLSVKSNQFEFVENGKFAWQDFVSETSVRTSLKDKLSCVLCVDIT